MQQTNSTPLWRELNEKRTQGEWHAKTYGGVNNRIETTDQRCITIADCYHEEKEAKKWMREDISKWEAEANAQYTALAVNNLHKLAEALEVAKKELKFLNVNEDGSQKANTPVSRVLSQIETALAAIS